MFGSESIITDYDNEFVYAKRLTGPQEGQSFKIPRNRIGPAQWIAKGEHIWYVEHGFWNFCKMFDTQK